MVRPSGGAREIDHWSGVKARANKPGSFGNGQALRRLLDTGVVFEVLGGIYTLFLLLLRTASVLCVVCFHVNVRWVGLSYGVGRSGGRDLG